ncbi:MAG: NAD(P)-dependent oxidoreductase [Desulfarculaceae bacterium]|nr:NAD(P)-dependent oxidoreductase [Desulfarculaceae bacterium]
MTVLITGGTGFIGSQVARLALAEGLHPVLLDPAPPGPSLADIAGNYAYVRSSMLSLSALVENMRSHEVDTVFHLGGMLSVPSEEDPWSAFEVNIHGTYRMLEAARLSGVKQFVLASSIAVYGEDIPDGPVTEATVEHPASMYGVCKIFGEQMGKHYQRRFGLDFRALRLSSVVGPGSKVAHMSIYNCWAIEKPLLGQPYQILVEPQTRCPVIYYRDAAQAMLQLSQAPESAIKTRVYNVNGVHPPYSAEELVEEVRGAVPGAQLSFTPDAQINRMISGVARLDLDDVNAREEWGWRPPRDLSGMVRQFMADFKAMQAS